MLPSSGIDGPVLNRKIEEVMKGFLQRAFQSLAKIQHPYSVLTAFFILTRIILWQVRPMLIDLLNMHFLDVGILRHNLFHGLYYMHAQPPLFNLFLGLVLKAAPAAKIHIVFPFLYSLMGWVLGLATYRLMRDLRLSQPTALLLTAGLMVFPSMIQAETWLYFSYPVTLLLVLTALALFRALHEQRIAFGMAFLLLMSALVLMRSSYHLVVWMAPLVILFLHLVSRKQGRKAVIILTVWSVMVSLLPAAIYLRNYRHYGVFQSSTWIGFSAWSMTYFVNIDPPRIEKLIREKKITPLARLERFAPVESYLAYYKENRKTGIDVLDQLHVSGRETNFNHFIYPRADAETYRNSVAIIREYPLDYWEAVLDGVYTFFGFSPYRFFDKARSFLIPKSITGFILAYLVPPLFLAAYVCVLLTLSKRLGFEWRGRDPDFARVGVLVYMIFTIEYMTLQTILLVFPEANYIRIPMDPLLIVGLGMAIDDHLPKSSSLIGSKQDS